MERYLLVSGRIISFILAIVGVLLLVLMLTGILFVNATSVVPAFGQNLVNEHVIDDLPPAIWQSFVEAIPPEVQVGSVTIQTEPLVTALGAALQDIVASGMPVNEWLQARAQEVVTSVIGDLRGAATAAVSGGVEDLQAALSGTAAEQLADVVLAVLGECTDAQVSQISQVLGTAPSDRLSVAVSFLCRPPDNMGAEARDLMKNALVVVLAEIGRQVAGDLQSRIMSFDLSDIVINTPLGDASIEWPDIRIGSGFLSFTIPIPDSIVQAVEELAGQLSAQLTTAAEQVTGRVEESRATLEAAGSALATEVTTRIPPTATVTPLPATATPTATPAPTQSPEEAEAARNAVSPLEQRVLDLLNGLGEILATATGQLTTIFLLVLGLPLLIHTYLQLYLMRTVRLWLLWIGIVLAASGAILMVINSRLMTNLTSQVAPTGNSTLPAPLATVAGNALLALQSALQTELNAPFMYSGLILLAIGVVLIVVISLQLWRARRLAAPAAPAAAS